MYVRPFTKNSRNRLSKALEKSNAKTFKPLPTDWSEFVKLTRIRSGNKIVQFDPYSYQVDLVNTVEANYGTVAVKPRQMGFTQTVASLFTFKACLNPAYTALILSKNQDDTRKIAERIREMLNCLTDYVEPETDSKLHIRIRNGGQIYFRNSKIDGARGIDSVSDVLFDEAAFIEDIDSIYSAVLPCTEMVGDDAKIIILSTPNGQSGFYWDMLTRNRTDGDFTKVVENIRNGKSDPVHYYSRNRWATFIVHWKAHPLYSQKPDYLENIRDNKGLSWEKVLQEYDLSFIDNEVTVFSTEIVRSNISDEITESDGSIYIGIDTSGLGDDYTVGTVIQDYGDYYQEIDMYRKRKQTSDYNIFKLVELIEKHNPDTVGIEVTGGTGQVYFEQLARLCPDIEFVAIKTTGETKPQMIDRLKLALEKNKVRYPSDSPLISELLTFRKKGRKLESVSGKHDDVLMATAFAVTVTPFGTGRESLSLFTVAG